MIVTVFFEMYFHHSDRLINGNKRWPRVFCTVKVMVLLTIYHTVIGVIECRWRYLPTHLTWDCSNFLFSVLMVQAYTNRCIAISFGKM